MESTLRFGSIRSLLTLGVFLLTCLLVAPAAFAELPSSVASRVKKVETALTAADKALEADRLQTAQRKLKEAQRPLKEIADRYAGKFDESDAVYKAMREHLAATTARVRAAEKQATEGEQADAEAKATHEAFCREWVKKLGPYVDRRSEQYLRIGSDLNSATPEEQARCKAAYGRAKALFESYKKVEFASGKTTQLQNVESSLASALKYYGAEEDKAAREAACQEWVDRLAPYVDPGMKSERKLIASATADPAQIARQQELYGDARALFALYREAEFPLGKSFRLETLEASMVAALEEYPKAMAESQAMISGDVGTRLDQVLRHMNRDMAWKQDRTKKPPLIMVRNLMPLREAVEQYAGTVQSGDETLAELRSKLERIEEQNAEHREICAKRTFQRADGYAGAELENLKKKARAAAAEARSKATIQIVTVPSEDWVVEDVVEFTDTSKTALRHRVTRSVRAEVSLKDAEGGVWVLGIYLGQDRLPDGGWGVLKGHMTWADLMAPGNLGKTASGQRL